MLPRHFVFALTVCFLAPAISSATTLATVSGIPITESMLLAANPAAAHDPQLKAALLAQLREKALLAGTLAKNPQAQEHQQALEAALADNRLQIEANMAVQIYLQDHPITETELQAQYAKLQKSYPQRQYRLREIVTPEFSDAQKILQELRSGASFSNLAAQYSVAGDAAVGGEMGWLPESAIPATYLRYLHDFQPLRVIGPLTVPAGWAIIQIMGERWQSAPPFAAIKGQLAASLEKEKIAAYIQKLDQSDKSKED
jgi:peptidyl-prolyl cis-trans isomerase C